MITIVKEYEMNEDDVDYIVQELSNGGTVKFLKPDKNPPEPLELPFKAEDLINEITEAQLEMQANIQYLVDLAEINMED